MTDNFKTDRGRPLTEEENAALRDMLDRVRTAKWFSTLFITFAGLAAAFLTIRDSLGDILRWLTHSN